MLDSKASRTIKETRAELREWGRFWQRYGTEISSGGSLFAAFVTRMQKSNPKFHRRARVGQKDFRAQKLEGVERPVTATCSPTHSPILPQNKEVFVPWSLQGIDDFIESMQTECSEALKQRYIKDDRNFRSIWLDRAEKLVMYR